MPMTEGIIAKSTTITGHGGDEIEAYLAHPLDGGGQPGVVVLHHMPGYDRATKEIVRTFAVYGYAALMPNLHHRYAGRQGRRRRRGARDAGGVPTSSAWATPGRPSARCRPGPRATGRSG